MNTEWNGQLLCTSGVIPVWETDVSQERPTDDADKCRSTSQKPESGSKTFLTPLGTFSFEREWTLTLSPSLVQLTYYFQFIQWPLQPPKSKHGGPFTIPTTSKSQHFKLVPMRCHLPTMTLWPRHSTKLEANLCFTCLEGAKEIRAWKATLKLIRAIIQTHDPLGNNQTNQNTQGRDKGPSSSDNRSDREESQEAPDNTRNHPELSEWARRCYQLLVFLWVISKSMGL